MHLKRGIDITLIDLFMHKGANGYSEQVETTIHASYVYDKDIKISVDEEKQKIVFTKNGVSFDFKMRDYTQKRR